MHPAQEDFPHYAALLRKGVDEVLAGLASYTPTGRSSVDPGHPQSSLDGVKALCSRLSDYVSACEDEIAFERGPADKGQARGAKIRKANALASLKEFYGH